MAIPSNHAVTPENLRPSVFLWVSAFLFFSTLYVLTAQCGVSWQDSGMFQWRILNADYAGNLGLALAHPLYIFFGRISLLIPFGSEAARINALSGIGMAVGLANITIIGYRLTGRLLIGIATALMLSVMHTIWWLSTIAEVYTWNAAFLTGELLMLVSLARAPRWRTAAALFFLNGINVCIHNLALLALPVYVCVVCFLTLKKQLPARTIFISACAYTAGASLFIAMALDLALTDSDFLAAAHSALFGKYASQVLNTEMQWHFFKENAGLAFLNFINFSLPLAVIGWLKMKKHLGGFLAAALGAITAIEFIFAIRYPVPDQFTFLLPSLVMISIAAALGISVLADSSRSWRNAVAGFCLLSILLPPIAYANGPGIIRRLGMAVQRSRELPFRDEVRYWMVPWKHNERSAELFAAAALKEAFPNGIIICDSTSCNPLILVQKRDKLCPDVSIRFMGEISAQQNKNPMYLPSLLRERPLFVISPVLIAVSGEYGKNMVCDREKGKVLYSVKWM